MINILNDEISQKLISDISFLSFAIESLFNKN